MGARRRVILHMVQQRRQHRITQPAPLMLGQHSHVDHVEVPAPVTEHTTHGNDVASALVHDVAGEPTAQQPPPPAPGSEASAPIAF